MTTCEKCKKEVNTTYNGICMKCKIDMIAYSDGNVQFERAVMEKNGDLLLTVRFPAESLMYLKAMDISYMLREDEMLAMFRRALTQR